MDDIPLPNTDELASRGLWLALIDQRVIKQPAINFPWSLVTSVDVANKRKKEFHRLVEQDLKEIKVEDREKLIETILSTLIKSVGKIKTLSNINITCHPLEDYFKVVNSLMN